MTALVSHEIPPATHWSLQLAAGRELRLTARQAGVNCSTLLFAARDRVDRLNVPDTLKAQMSARVHPPMVLMSDRGTALASVTGSSLDWHDALTGHSPTGARAGLLSELRKHGRDLPDLHACVNFFSRVSVADDDRGTLTFATEHAAEGDWVTLRAEQDLLVICSTVPHPLDPTWAPGAVLAEVHPAPPYGPDDPSVTFRAESARALAAAQAVFA
jgi:uncharacterized protein YcgI (DUF1989 family)